MDAIDTIFSNENEIVETLKGYTKEIDYKKLFYEHLGPELKKLFDSKKDKVCLNHFLEASKYEYGFDGEKIDLPKALSLYKKYADLNDYFCMYKMHIIYLCEYEKFNVPLNRVLEKIYFLKCFAYLPIYVIDWDLKLFEKIDIKMEIAQMLDLEDTNLEKHKLFFDLLIYQNEKYNLSENDVNLMKEVLICYFEKDEEKEMSFCMLNSLIPKNELDYAYYHSKSKSIYYQNYFKLGNIISDADIENFYKEVKDKKLYEFYSDYGNYLLDKIDNSTLEIIDILTSAANHGDLFGCFRVYQSLIDYYDFDVIMEDYDKACNILDYLLDEIVFERLLLTQFILLTGLLIEHSKFPEKIMSKYLVYVKEIDHYVTLYLEKMEKDQNVVAENDEYFYFIKAYMYYFGFKDVEEQNLPKAIELLGKGINICKEITNKKRNDYLRLIIQKLMNSRNLLSNDELLKAKKNFIEINSKGNRNLKYQIIDCYILGEDYFDGIINKQDQSNTMLIYKHAQKIFCKTIVDWQLRNEVKIFLKTHEYKFENHFKDETCCVCYEKKVNKIFIPCKHNFCSFCADKLEKESKKCPVCRSEILFVI